MDHDADRRCTLVVPAARAPVRSRRSVPAPCIYDMISYVLHVLAVYLTALASPVDPAVLVERTF